MKRKLKITENTLFVYQQANQTASKSETDTTTITSALTTTTGIYRSKK